MATINPCLWFDNQAEQAAQFYTSVFPNSKNTNISHYTEAGPGEPGSVMVVEFELDGQGFMGLNGGPMFQFSEAISFYRNCESQEEVDDLWAKLTADGGEESQCGWLKDRFGVSWQIVPRALTEMIADPDPAKVAAVMQVMLQMRKIEIQPLLDAYASV
jgi:predicted 3-demethylubiquinone-9 3-methyltransferase (glyoxalase superfamily)